MKQKVRAYACFVGQSSEYKFNAAFSRSISCGSMCVCVCCKSVNALEKSFPLFSLAPSNSIKLQLPYMLLLSTSSY